MSHSSPQGPIPAKRGPCQKGGHHRDQEAGGQVDTNPLSRCLNADCGSRFRVCSRSLGPRSCHPSAAAVCWNPWKLPPERTCRRDGVSRAPRCGERPGFVVAGLRAQGFHPFALHRVAAVVASSEVRHCSMHLPAPPQTFKVQARTGGPDGRAPGRERGIPGALVSACHNLCCLISRLQRT